MPIQTAGSDEIVTIFKAIIEAVLIDHDIEKVINYISDDVIGIGMGSQGVVYGKPDVQRIMSDGKSLTDKTKVAYDSIQARCYDDKFGSVCGVLKISNKLNGKNVTSTLGQMINFRKHENRWLIFSLQATPIFEQIEELEAYPIKFAENVLESYRQQEQIAKNAQNDSVAIYMINFTKGIFESSIIKDYTMVKTQKGDPYEKIMFDSARKYMNDDDCYNFISTFSLGNIINSYKCGITELSTEYQKNISKKKFKWYKTIIKLYIDKADENLKGYLYVIDINNSKLREIELQSITELDSMTGLYNKKYTEIRVNDKLNYGSIPSNGVFFMIDLDYFKNINDTYGHHEGDRIIKETASLMLEITNNNDIAGRIGGDEFCIYFSEPYNAKLIIKKATILCKSIRGLIQSNENRTSCSIGIVFCTGSETSFEDIYIKADKALYQQKSNGRDGFTIYSE